MPSSTGCLWDNQWWIPVSVSAGIFLSGLIMLGLIRILTHYTKIQSRARQTRAHHCYTSIKGLCEGWISGSTMIGRVVISISCIFSIGSLVIYIVDVSRLSDLEVHTCESLPESISQQIDLVFNIYFLLHFMLRYVAANDKLMFWLELNSLVDFFTVPPVFLSVIMDQQWLGFRFLRAIRLINIPDLLQYLRVLRTSNTIRLSQLISILVSVWLAAAGFVHLAENTGGLTGDEEVSQSWTYWGSAYFIVITLSTVGYGDFSCKSLLGQAFIVIFIFSALAMFASFVPEIAEIFGKQKRYKGSFETRAGFSHVVLCGHITFDSVDDFLKDFHHKDRGNNAVRSVFLHNAMPDLELEALLKRHFTNVTYLRGMVTNPKHLKRVKLKEAEACLIMANPQASDPDSEDAANIMRLISVKNYHPSLRVIIQLISYRNKAFCMNLPFWTSHDQVISLSEMKLGFMAAGILAPGFSTLMANLFVMTSFKSSSKRSSWQNQYMRGAGMEIYIESFSPAFHGRTFSTVFEMCYSQLGLLLIAVAYRALDHTTMTARSKVVLNPGSNFVIDSSMKGFFICQSEEEAKLVITYCPDCFTKESGKRRAKICTCRDQTRKDCDTTLISLAEFSEKKELTSPDIDNVPRLPLQEAMVQIEINVSSPIADEAEKFKLEEKGKETFETSGMFHWCPTVSFEQCILEDNSEIERSLDKHVIVCCFGDDNASTMSLRNLALPLRASNIPRSELHPIVLVGDEDFLRYLWSELANYPYIYAKLGSPLNRSVLRSLSIGRCHMCLILSANTVSTDDATLSDKESILCTLNIKTMSLLPQTFADLQRPLVKVPSGAFTLQVPQEDGKRSGGSSVAEPKNNIFMLTEIAHDGNSQYIDQDDEDDPDAPLYLTQPFCCGRVFSASVLGSLMSSIYYNAEVLNLIRTLVIGGDAVEMEQILAEGMKLDQCSMSDPDLFCVRNRSRIGLLSVKSRLLRSHTSQAYGHMVVQLERELGILCLGIYRLLSTELYEAESHNRYVITNPPEDFQLEPYDKVFCLRPFVTRSPRSDSTTAAPDDGSII